MCFIVFASLLYFTGESLRVLFAYYGISCANNRHIWPNILWKSENWVKNRCNRSSCYGVVTPEDFGNPYPNCNGDFLVVAECDGGVIKWTLTGANKLFELFC